MATLEELQARIQRLEDIKVIEKLQRIYGYYRDYADWEKIVDLFSDNAESVEIADLGVYKGKAGVTCGDSPGFGGCSVNMKTLAGRPGAWNMLKIRTKMLLGMMV